MKKIKNDYIHEIIIKNSRFICILKNIDDISTINNILDEIKLTYPKATHYTYAYIFNESKKSSDDGEPTGTAGPPILNVLESNNLNNILCVVVRYFGGIKLGAGGLIRAYTKSVTESLKEVDLDELVKGKKIEIIFNYSDEKQVNYILNNSKIINKEFNEQIRYTVLVTNEILEKLNNYTTNVIEELYIEKI